MKRVGYRIITHKLSMSSISIIFGLIVFLDRMTKSLALAFLRDSDCYVLPFLNFSLAWNRGVSWGVFGDASPFGYYFLSALIACLIVAFSVYAVIEHRHGRNILFELFVLAGAASNFFDRIYYGAVIDFIDFHTVDGIIPFTGGFSPPGWHWPTFNIADSCIVIGVAGIILRGIVWTKKKK